MAEALDEEHWSDRMNREFAEAPDREAKLTVLKRYMSEGEAEDAIGMFLGEHNGDVTGVEGRE